MSAITLDPMKYSEWGSILNDFKLSKPDDEDGVYKTRMQLIHIFNQIIEAETKNPAAIKYIKDMRNKLAHDSSNIAPADLRAFVQAIQGKDLRQALILPKTALYQALYPKTITQGVQGVQAVYYARLQEMSTHPVVGSKTPDIQQQYVFYRYAKDLRRLSAYLQNPQSQKGMNYCIAMFSEICLQLNESVEGQAFLKQLQISSVSKMENIRKPIFHGKGDAKELDGFFSKIGVVNGVIKDAERRLGQYCNEHSQFDLPSAEESAANESDLNRILASIASIPPPAPPPPAPPPPPSPPQADIVGIEDKADESKEDRVPKKAKTDKSADSDAKPSPRVPTQEELIELKDLRDQIKGTLEKARQIIIKPGMHQRNIDNLLKFLQETEPSSLESWLKTNSSLLTSLPKDALPKVESSIKNWQHQVDNWKKKIAEIWKTQAAPTPAPQSHMLEWLQQGGAQKPSPAPDQTPRPGGAEAAGAAAGGDEALAADGESTPKPGESSPSVPSRGLGGGGRE